METIVGAVIVKDNKILMVRESKKECYSKWAFPAGHLENGETIIQAAKREILEESGCKVELKKVFPIIVHNSKDKNIMMIHFFADLTEETFKYDTNEIIETKWMSLTEIKNMEKKEFRSYPVVNTIIESLEKDNLCELNVFTELKDI